MVVSVLTRIAFTSTPMEKISASTDYEDAFVLHRGAAATIPGEDCLRLNLWSSEINGTHKRPVMVYMHGGGFSSGSGHDLLSCDGENLTSERRATMQFDSTCAVCNDPEGQGLRLIAAA